VGHRFVVAQCHSWSETLVTIRTRPVEVAVIDPGLEGVPRAHDIGQIHASFPSLPIVLYARLHSTLATVLLELGALGVREVIVADHDDDPERLREVLQAESARSVSQLLSQEVQDMLGDTPADLRWAVERVFRQPAEIRTVQELARHARMDRRTCGRWFARSGLPPPNDVLTQLRALYAHRLLLDPGYRVEDVSMKLGYAKSRSLSAATKRVFGLAPADLRIELSRSAAVAVVRRNLLGGEGVTGVRRVRVL